MGSGLGLGVGVGARARATLPRGAFHMPKEPGDEWAPGEELLRRRCWSVLAAATASASIWQSIRLGLGA